MSFLLDANVLSEPMSTRPNPQVLAWMERHDASCYVSTLTLGEILVGIELLPAGRRRRGYEIWFERLVASFAGRIVSFDEDACRTWGPLCAAHERKGRKLPAIDSLIAATAIAHGHTLATRNVTDFPDDVPVVNPGVSS